MRRHDLITSSVWFLIGLSIAIYAPTYGLGTPGMVGSGFIPFIAGILMCCFSAATFLNAYLDKSGIVKRIWGNIQFRNLFLVLFALLIYILLLEKVGFIICTFFLIVLLFRFIDPETWLTSLLGGGLSSILLYLIFETWLEAQLPKGFFGF
ncbi:MAG: hypothetical protein A3J94_03555 [Syntrophus sp. RIFOXYC2_FULL_54_9]|nr:MAG: hypothetical protein A3J94_03555 [Syntrophus sp. RIFOXYC2_FULL_54_9]